MRQGWHEVKDNPVSLLTHYWVVARNPHVATKRALRAAVIAVANTVDTLLQNTETSLVAGLRNLRNLRPPDAAVAAEAARQDEIIIIIIIHQ